jgi:hydroxymethylpyrimidine pyrophosphatase-like HAD family hydrolase
MGKVVIVDIDGTVAERTNRSAYDYSKVSDDAPKPEVIEVVNSLWRAGHKIYFISGRKAVCFADTYKWLTENCPPFVKLYMREDKDNRSDAIIKQEIFENNFNKEDILCVIDDRQRVVDMWRSIGLVCLQVDHGNF